MSGRHIQDSRQSCTNTDHVSVSGIWTVASKLCRLSPGWQVRMASQVCCICAQHTRQEDNAVFMILLDATSTYDTVSHRGISMACKSFAVPTDVESMLLAHVGGHSRVVNTAYGLGEADTKVTLDGGLAQGANISQPLDIFKTAPAHRYAYKNLPDSCMLHAKCTAPGWASDAYRVGLLNHADDDVVLKGPAATTRGEVEQILNETNFAAEALTMSLAVVGVCTNQAKRMLQCSPAAQKLLLLPVLWCTALNADGVLLRDKGLTIRSTSQTTGTAHDPD